MQCRNDTVGRVLIADDDPVFLALASACLLAAGQEVKAASDGADALEQLANDRFDIAIVDLDMPRIDGLRLIGLVRAMRQCANLAILVISASQSVKLYDEARALGADAHLTKPVDWSVLPHTIAEVRTRRTAARVGRAVRH